MGARYHLAPAVEKPISNLDFKGEYERNLPHLQPPGATFFITTRLAGSLPASLLHKLAQEAAKISASEYTDNQTNRQEAALERERYWFREYEKLLHEITTGPHWLADARIATMLAETLHHRADKQYRLDAFCIMPNHLHLVLQLLLQQPVPPDAVLRQDHEGNIGYQEKSVDGASHFVRLTYHALAAIMHRIKRRSAHEANKLLCRSGEFWEHESFDHYCRDQAEWQRTIKYVLNNPVKAGLVQHWIEWKWTYASPLAVAQDGILHQPKEPEP